MSVRRVLSVGDTRQSRLSSLRQADDLTFPAEVAKTGSCKNRAIQDLSFHVLFHL